MYQFPQGGCANSSLGHLVVDSGEGRIWSRDKLKLTMKQNMS